jgi:hypothetical protein
VPGKVLDIDKRLLLEKGADFETLSDLQKASPLHLSILIWPSPPNFPPLASFVPPAFYGPSPFLSHPHPPHPLPQPSDRSPHAFSLSSTLSPPSLFLISSRAHRAPHSHATVVLCMAFRRPSASTVSPVNPYASYPATTQNQQQQPQMQDDSTKRTDPAAHPPATDQFINDQDANDSAGDDDEEEEKVKSDKKTGRRKIKIEFIQDKSRRHITFSKRKAGPSSFSSPPLLSSSPCPLTLSSWPISPGIMKKVGSYVVILLPSFYLMAQPFFLSFFLSLGIRTFHPHRNTSPSTRRLRDWFGIHLHYCQVATPRHAAGRQESHPGMPQRASWYSP